MLPLFRKIRRQLADDNQFLKYSRYAIGEIVLVVIGILIALQINNWNEEKKLKNDLKLHLKSLITDVENDIDNLEELKRWSLIRYHLMQGLLNHVGQKQNLPVYQTMPGWEKGNLGYDSLPKTFDLNLLNQAVRMTQQMTSVSPTKNAIDQLKNSGLLSFIEKKETIALMDEYYEEFESTIGKKEWESLRFYKEYWLRIVTDNGLNLEGVDDNADLIDWLKKEGQGISALRNLIINAEWNYAGCNITIDNGRKFIHLIDETIKDL